MIAYVERHRSPLSTAACCRAPKRSAESVSFAVVAAKAAAVLTPVVAAADVAVAAVALVAVAKAQLSSQLVALH